MRIGRDDNGDEFAASLRRVDNNYAHKRRRLRYGLMRYGFTG
jgi:hypothetical protein